MMKYNELPKEILSPISGDKMRLMDKYYPNECFMSIVNNYQDSAELYENSAAMYLSENGETIYVPFDSGDIPTNESPN